ncbi:MAG: hypothetical protein ACRDGA_13145 [Bacteroidota bacterium]
MSIVLVVTIICFAVLLLVIELVHLLLHWDDEVNKKFSGKKVLR